MEDIKEVNLDFQRENRTGLAEAVFCAGKSQAQLETICQTVIDAGRPMLFTRLDPDAYRLLEQQFPGVLGYDPTSRTAFHLPHEPGSRSSVSVAIVTGGSSDLPVAREASRTLTFYGHRVLEIHDVGVAGLWRITERLDELRTCKIIICVAGMDAALPTVLGGLVPAVLIAVPTSVGYGMVKGGETALRSLLVSCAPGLTVTNIDNGYGAACAAIRVINNIA
ncbi:MAG: nickel pincer cofactor biosynthesis protein LarB [Proteobacteria bacterium]|nr:nickel pincer cofactor biosynthesis protein LarB [Pseudomonadota bacterium]